MCECYSGCIIPSLCLCPVLYTRSPYTNTSANRVCSVVTRVSSHWEYLYFKQPVIYTCLQLDLQRQPNTLPNMAVSYCMSDQKTVQLRLMCTTWIRHIWPFEMDILTTIINHEMWSFTHTHTWESLTLPKSSEKYKWTITVGSWDKSCCIHTSMLGFSSIQLMDETVYVYTLSSVCTDCLLQRLRIGV